MRIFSPLFFLWNIVGWCVAIILPFILTSRVKKNLEDKNHLLERYGFPSFLRPEGKIIWIHAASIGETRAAFALIEHFLKQDPSLTILMTTATLTGKETLKRHSAYQKRVFHHFIPYDIFPWNKNFLTYWKPSAAIFIENELWPGFLILCKKENIPVFLVNARLSEKSFQKWRLIPVIFRSLLKNITLIIPRNLDDAHLFQYFSSFDFPYIGDIKEYTAPLFYDSQEALLLKKKFKGRALFVAASTHEGEEEIIIYAAKKAQKKIPSLLTIIIPRHPQRGQDIYKIIDAPLRSKGEIPLPSDNFWIIDTLGEVGLFYALTKRVFLGNSLIPSGGGHNPYEALHFGCSIATGPYLSHWQAIYKKLHNKVEVFSKNMPLETQFFTWLQSPIFASSPLAPQDELPHKIVNHILNTSTAR